MFKNKFQNKLFFAIFFSIFNFSILDYIRSESENIQQISEINQSYNINFDQYLIGPGDKLNLKLFDSEEFSGTFKVMSDGLISLPLVGSVDLNFLTIEDAQKKLKKLYAEVLLRPELNLTVEEERPIKISVIGEVEKPGIYTLSEDNNSKVIGSDTSSSGLPTLFNAIQKAGGLTQNANLKNIELRRRLPGKEASFKKAKLNLLDLVLEGNQMQNPYLFDGDVIRITEALNQKYSGSITNSNLTSDSITINVVGFVKSPGKYSVKRGTSLAQGIYTAQGPINWKSNKGKVELIRINDNGSANLRRFNLDISQNTSEEKNPLLKDQDIIRVRQTLYSNLGDGIRVVSEPLTNLVTIYSLFKIID